MTVNLTDVVTDFLRARLDEDAADANDYHDARRCGSLDRDGGFDLDMCDCDYPPRILREVEAKRNIIGGLLALARQRREMRDHIYLPENAEYHSGHADGMEDSAAWALRLFAAVYRDHPDYDPAWAPSD